MLRENIIKTKLFKIFLSTTRQKWGQQSGKSVKESRKKTPSQRALQHFDNFYKGVFENSWPSIRLGLLCPNKYIAVVNNYSDTEKIEECLQSEGAINFQSLVEVQKSKKRSKSLKRKTDRKVHLDKVVEEINLSQQREEISSINPGSSSNVEEDQSKEDRLVIAEKGASLSNMYEHIPPDKLKGMEDWVLESEYYSHYETPNDFPVTVKQERFINFPKILKIYTFESGNVSAFKTPKKGSTGVLDYYLMDGSSLLPVLALDLRYGDQVLDLCAAPGGKSLLCLQTLLPETLLCNDLYESRTNRLRRVFSQFLYDFKEKLTSKKIIIKNEDARNIDVFEENKFNKILVDVPCTTDRHSALVDDNNIYRPDRVKERIKLPILQTELLVNALKMVSQGGTVVYSTCTLSPIQNDGVVHMALRRIWQETDYEIVVKDMSWGLNDYRGLFQFANKIGLRYGHLVVPYLPSNFGPMYFCKLTKL